MSEKRRLLQVRLTPEQKTMVEELTDKGYNVARLVKNYLLRFYEEEKNRESTNLL